jgi:hypothetical protein
MTFQAARTCETILTSADPKIMRRVAAAKFGKRQPESNRASLSVPPGRRPLRGQKIGRATHRAGFGPPPRRRQATALIRGGPAKQVKQAWEVVRPSLPPARRAALRPSRKAGRLRHPPYRAYFRPPPRAPQSRLRIPGEAANQVEPADVVDDFPEDIPVMSRELKVIETYLAAVLDESLAPMSLEAENAAIETIKPDVE